MADKKTDYFYNSQLPHMFLLAREKAIKKGLGLRGVEQFQRELWIICLDFKDMIKKDPSINCAHYAVQEYYLELSAWNNFCRSQMDRSVACEHQLTGRSSRISGRLSWCVSGGDSCTNCFGGWEESENVRSKTSYSGD